MADDIVLPIPNLNLAQQLFALSKPGLAALHNDARKSLLDGINADRACILLFITMLMPMEQRWRRITR